MKFSRGLVGFESAPGPAFLQATRVVMEVTGDEGNVKQATCKHKHTLVFHILAPLPIHWSFKIHKASGCKPISTWITCQDNNLETTSWHSLSTKYLHHWYCHQREDSTAEVFQQDRHFCILFSPFFTEIVSTYYLPHFWEVTAQIVPPDSIFRNTKPLHVWSAFTKSSATCRKDVCLIHSQMKSRSNALFLSGSSPDALKRHILAFREVKHLFSQLWNSPFKGHLVDQFLERYTYPG